MKDSDARKKPQGGVGDVAHTVAKVGLSGIPWVGGPAAEIFSAIIAPPLSKRRDRWIQSIAAGLERLEKEVEGFRIEELSKNDMFITTVMQASQAAIRNHQQEKLEALRNAVLNAALPNPPEEDMQLMFLNFVDTLTSWHLRVLEFFEYPIGWADKQQFTYPDVSMSSPAQVLECRFPALRGRREFYDQIVRDLFNRGLMNTESLHVTMTASGIFASRTTDMGKRFIKFITSPLKDDNEEPME